MAMAWADGARLCEPRCVAVVMLQHSTDPAAADEYGDSVGAGDPGAALGSRSRRSPMSDPDVRAQPADGIREGFSPPSASAPSTTPAPSAPSAPRAPSAPSAPSARWRRTCQTTRATTTTTPTATAAPRPSHVSTRAYERPARYPAVTTT